MIDTLGLPVVVKVHPANIHDSVRAIHTIRLMKYDFPGMKKIIADGGYRGTLTDKVKEYGWELSVAFRLKESSKKFKVLPLLWIVVKNILIDCKLQKNEYEL